LNHPFVNPGPLPALFCALLWRQHNIGRLKISSHNASCGKESKDKDKSLTISSSSSSYYYYYFKQKHDTI